ncbi:MAG: autotransporter-associated beta strand repeat-containing protein [Planctomycetia bacterium]|nr:autotransporter-associated beta strand repeat-containing protein [Planctomycetia bacterium]
MFSSALSVRGVSRLRLAAVLSILGLLPAAAILTADPAHAEYYKWNGAAGATWDTSATNWLLYDGSPVSGTLWSSAQGTFGGNWAEFYNSGSATISGDIYARGMSVKSGVTFTINGNGLNYAYDNYIASDSTLAITGNTNFGGGITLFNGGTLRLSGNNSNLGDQVYWGPGGGVLELLSSTALQGNIGVWAADDANGQSVKLGNGSTISIGQTFNMQGTGVTGDGALFVNDGTTNTWGSGITLAQNSTIGVGSGGGKLNVSGPISGGNNLTVKAQGSGTVALSGNNTYTGTTTVSAGTLQIGNGGATGSLGSGDVSLSVGTTLEFNRSNDSTVSNTITGDGGLTKSGNGLVSVTGNNTYTGTTRVSAGTLKIGDGGATGSVGSGDISVAAGAKLEFNRSGNTTVANNITSDEGISQINMTGGDTLTLTGNVKYGYESFVNRGSTLVMTGNVDSWGGITLTGGGTLKLSGTSVGNGNSDMYLVGSSGIFVAWGGRFGDIDGVECRDGNTLCTLCPIARDR